MSSGMNTGDIDPVGSKSSSVLLWVAAHGLPVAAHAARGGHRGVKQAVGWARGL
jgi:hypothetical protein